MLGENRKLIEETETPTAETIAVLFRNMHTLKGNSRVHALSQIVDSAHLAEEAYGVLRKASRDEPEALGDGLWNRESLLEDLSRVESDLARYQRITEEKLGNVSAPGGEREAAFVKEAKVILGRQATSHEELLAMRRQLVDHLTRMDTEELEEILEDILSSVKTLAEDLGKPVPEIHVDGHGYGFSHETASCFRNVFTHLVRNSMDHGIESPDVRSASGKREAGEIHVEVVEDHGCPTIHLWDDGAGLNLKALEDKARESGIIKGEEHPADQSIADTIFSAGVSTAETLTDVSGRGVGMDAVSAELQKMGSKIKIEFTADTLPTGRRPFRFSIACPSEEESEQSRHCSSATRPR